jgi:predicted ATPase/DNA-binding CsgD family transcriptional regulator
MASRLRTGNLPADLSSFVGRRREVSEVKRLLAVHRMLTLTGPGGVGKTRLALRAAGDVRRGFPDGAWLVDLAELEDPDLLGRTVTAALGLDDPSSSSPLARLLDYLEQRELLLVLDNCEHLLDACAILAGKLLAATPGLHVMATSRQALNVEGEHVLTVSPLPVPHTDRIPPVGGLNQYDSVRLFEERAAEVLPGFEVDADNRIAVARLCQRLDGIPLAIELAAVRLRSLSVEKILDRLDNRFQLLASGSVGPLGGTLPRRQTLWAAIDWSFDLCAPEEQALWERLSVFAGGFDLQAAQEVCSGDGIEQQDVFDLVAGLVDKSILVREGFGVRARYRLLETIRQFGRARLVASGQERVLRARHRDYYRHLALQAEQEWFSPRQVEWLTRLQREHANLRVALEFCLTEPGEARVAQEIAGSLRSFWMGSGFVGEGRRWLRQALNLGPEPTPARAKALWVAACLALMPGDLEPALAMLDECHALARRLGDASAEAYAIEYSGMAALFGGDFSAALSRLQDALERHRESGDLSGVSVTLNQMLLVASILGDPRAAALGEECLFLCETHGAQWSRSYVLWSVGLRKWRHGDRYQATALLRKAVRLKRLFKDPWGTGLCIEVLAWSAAADGHYEKAARLLGACDTAWQLSGTSLSLASPDLAFHVQCEEQARRALGEERFAELFSEGARLSLDGAIDHALDEKGHRARQDGTAGPDDLVAGTGLTRREREVAELVAQGLSNKDIAARLAIARRTTEAHIEHILAKLGFSSRAEVAAWVAERGS